MILARSKSTYKLIFNTAPKNTLHQLGANRSQEIVLNAVHKALAQLENNPRHNSLNSKRFYSLEGPNKEKIFESYVQNNTPGAYRIFWYFGPNRKEITVVLITPHP